MRHRLRAAAGGGRGVGPQTLRPGRAYSLEFAHLCGNGRAVCYYGRLYFTSEDLASLRPGQAWADGRARSRKDFDALVADKC